MALIMVVIGCNETILLPGRTLELHSPTAYVKNDKALVVVDNRHQRVIFANQNQEIIRILEVGQRDLPFDKISGAFLIDDHVIISAVDQNDMGIVVAREILAEYTQEGEFLRIRHQVNYTPKEDLVREGFQCVTKSDWGLLLTSLRGKEIKYEEITYQGARTIFRRKLDFMPWITHRMGEFKSLILGVDGWYRYYDGENDSLTLLGRGVTPRDKNIISNSRVPSSLFFSWQFFVENWLFWISVGILALLAITRLFDLFKLLKKNADIRKKIFALTGAVILAVSISLYYSSYVMRGIVKRYSVLAEVECRIAYDCLVKDHGQLFQLLKEKDIVEFLNDHTNCQILQEYVDRINSICSANGPTEAFSGALLIKDRDGRTRIVADTTMDYADGDVYWDLDATKDKSFEDKPDVFVTMDEDDNEVFQTAFRKLYREDGTCFGFLNLDVNTRKIYSQQETLILRTTVQLLIAMIAVYIICSFSFNAIREFQTVRQYRREGRKIIGGELINTCAFLGGIAIGMEEVLWVFAVMELCRKFGGNDSKMIAFLVAATAASAFCMTFIFPKLRSLLSDVVVLIIGIVGVLLGFYLKLMAFIQHDPTFYAMGFTLGYGISSGIYKPAILSLSLQFNDIDKRANAVNDSYVAYAMASAAALMVGTLIQSTYDFPTLYVFAIGLMIVVSPLLIFAVASSSEAVQEKHGFNYRTMWKFYANFKGLGYLFTMLLPQIIICLFGAKLCSAILAQIGVDSYKVTNITILGLTLFSLFPSGKIIEKYGMKVAGIIIYCTLALEYILVSGNNRVGWIIIVTLLTSVTFSESFGNNVLLDLADKGGYSRRATNDGNVFLANLLTVPVAWFLGQFLAISEVMVFEVAGLMIFAAVGLGCLFSRMGKTREQ